MPGGQKYRIKASWGAASAGGTYVAPTGPQTPPPRRTQCNVDKPGYNGFWDSLGDSWHSMQDGWTGIILDLWGYDGEANRYYYKARKAGPYGQTEDSDGLYYYGTRGAMAGAYAAGGAAAAVGVTEVICLGNESVLEFNVLSDGNVFKVISRPGQWGFRVDPAHHGKPWGHTHVWNW